MVALLATLLLGFLPGCATIWDDVITNQEFEVKDLFAEKPPPLWVIENSHDGDARARALAGLGYQVQEASPEQRKKIRELLAQHAIHDPLVPCRLAAIEALSSFEDRQAVEVLEEAYYQAASQGITPDRTSILRCHILRVLGEIRDPAAVELLVRVVKEPAVEGSAIEKQRRNNERVAAARALGNFNQEDSNRTLVHLLEQERDVALRNRIHRSLQQATGQDYPADADIWADYIEGRQPPSSKVQPVGFVDRMIRQLSWQTN